MVDHPLAFDPSALSNLETWNDPYPLFAHLQQHAPVCFSPTMGGWLLTRYADVSAALRDPRLSSRRSTALAERLPAPTLQQAVRLIQHLSAWALLMDPPDHTGLRGLINKAFSTTLVERMRPRLQALVDQCLDRAEARGELEVMHDLAIPLPVAVIADVLGLPGTDGERLRAWSDAFVALFHGLSGRVTTEVLDRAGKAVAELEAYLDAVIAERRHTPRDDLVSALIGAEEDGRILNDQELRSTCAMLLFGGHETTTNLIGNGLYTLLTHPDQLALLKNSPDLGPSAVEELLRYESPVQWFSRIASEDLELSGQALSKGTRVFLMLGAANRDPDQFPDPDRLDLRRPNNRHLAFGQGPHYCVGAPLGRLEGQIALRTVLDRFPRVRLMNPRPEWSENPILRSLKRLRLAVA